MCSKDGVEYALETTHKPVPDASLMWRNGWIESVLVPLSGKIMEGVPQRETNRSIPINCKLESKDVNISTRTARVVKQVKMNLHTLLVVRQTLN